MERDLKVLLVGARYLVNKVFCTLCYDEVTKLYSFLPADLTNKTIIKCKFLKVGQTEGLKNPIFDLNKIDLSIKDYTLETGDYCKDFSKFEAKRILLLYSSDNIDELLDRVMSEGLISLFTKQVVPGKPMGINTEYSPAEFLDRYRNFLLTNDADAFL